MRKSVLFVILTFNTISCKSQKREEIIKTSKKDSMEYFDVKNYEDLKKDPFFVSYGYYYDINENKIQVYSNTGEKGFIKRITKKNSPFVQVFSFHPNGKLQLKAMEFYSFRVEIDKLYDETGKLIKEINNDLPYKFSVDDLREKIKKEYDVDIVSDYRDSDPTLIFVNRWLGYKNDVGVYKKDVPMYQVSFWKKEGKRLLEINATTGETITNKVLQ
ncbi:hypothetical protein [Flavobacterium columnare]|uniref:Uncharacterized protein n=1 Tax=Flavobacterium columnare TaxID=996 RepID=A0AA94F4P5_9FLAO|nr:hypothetical protein [Flavobacterium columnare]MCH4830215.1 hypothetical protein [Flavobacterium columnare]MCH4832402.1 hypothetical protein [Flavobacterium columnare]